MRVLKIRYILLSSPIHGKPGAAGTLGNTETFIHNDLWVNCNQKFSFGEVNRQI